MPCQGFFSVDSLRGVWALVVDGNPQGRRALEEILTYCGALVTSLPTPRDALSVMEQVKPDVLVVVGPADDDFDFIRQVRGRKPEAGGVVPAIAIGDLDGLEESVRARGFQTYLRMPLDPWALCRAVSGLMMVR